MGGGQCCLDLIYTLGTSVAGAEDCPTAAKNVSENSSYKQKRRVLPFHVKVLTSKNENKTCFPRSRVSLSFAHSSASRNGVQCVLASRTPFLSLTKLWRA